MKRLSEYQNEEAILLLSEILEPACEIFSDEEFIGAVRGKAPKIKWVQIAMKNHADGIMQILRSLSGDPEYKGNALSIPLDLLNVFNDPELMAFFSAQVQNTQDAPSGSASENTEDRKK